MTGLFRKREDGSAEGTATNGGPWTDAAMGEGMLGSTVRNNKDIFFPCFFGGTLALSTS